MDGTFVPEFGPLESTRPSATVLGSDQNVYETPTSGTTVERNPASLDQSIRAEQQMASGTNRSAQSKVSQVKRVLANGGGRNVGMDLAKNITVFQEAVAAALAE